jgi:hypothetical protein
MALAASAVAAGQSAVVQADAAPEQVTTHSTIGYAAAHSPGFMSSNMQDALHHAQWMLNMVLAMAVLKSCCLCQLSRTQNFVH